MSASPTSPCLEARDLACRRGDRRLFDGFQLAVRAGEAVWLQGRNGAGKTSLLRVLAGLTPPDAGTVAWHGQPSREPLASPSLRPLYLAHTHALKDDLTAEEALGFLVSLHGLVAGSAPQVIEAVGQTLAAWGLDAVRKRPVQTLSQGQRRRVALARLGLAQAQRIWLLDEPFDALDVDSVRALQQVIAAHQQRGGCVVLTSHQPVALEALAAVRQVSL